MTAGFTVNCPESGDTVLTDLREIGPTYYFAPPRVFENMLTAVMIRMEDAGAIKRRMLPITFDGRFVAAAILVIGIADVFAAKMQLVSVIALLTLGASLPAMPHQS